MSALPIRGPARGFTLLELLVAVAIFAVIGALAMGGYVQLQKQNEHTQARLDRVQEVQRAVQTMVLDFGQLEPRPVRETLGDGWQPALVAAAETEYRAQFTRAGWSNTAGLPRPTLQRVGYRIDDQGLWRDHWPVLDRTLGVEPVTRRLLGDVKSVSFRYLTANRQWVDQWPVMQRATGSQNLPDLRSRPVAVEFTIDLVDWGQIRRVVEIPG